MLFRSAPFVLFSYFLNGIDILQIVAALVLSAGWSALLTGVGIAIGTQAHSKLGRTVAHFVVLAVLGFGSMGGIAFAWVLAEEGARLVTNDAFRNVVIGVAFFSWALTWLSLESAASGLCLPSEAASRRPRTAYAIVGLLALAYGLLLFVLQTGRANDAVGGQVITSFFFTICGAFCVSEADGWPGQASRGGWLKPGAVRSFWLALALLLGSLALWSFLGSQSWNSASNDKPVRGIVGAFAYPALYLSLGVLIGRLTPLRRFGEPVATRVGFLICVTVGVAGSMALSLVFENRANGKVMNALNPIIGLVNFLDRSGPELDTALVLLCAATLLAVFLAAVVLHGRDEVRGA